MAIAELKLGLVGTGTGVVDQVACALRRQGKLRLAEVFDPCLASANIDAKLIEATSSPSLDGMLRRTSGVIVADVKWMGVEPMIRAAGFQRPALILTSAFSRLSFRDLARLQHFAELSSTLFMPELPLRWGRSSLRLRELTATHLGMIEQMEITCKGAVGSLGELQILDWCSSVVQSECLSVSSDPDGTNIRLQYWRKQRDGSPVTVHLSWKQEETKEPASSFPIIDCKVRCLRGQVHLTSESELSWEQSDRAAGQPQTESLQSDRTAEELMYNLFGRRLVGGLVPVPDISDLIRAHAIRAARDVSRKNQEDVPPIFSENA